MQQFIANMYGLLAQAFTWLPQPIAGLLYAALGVAFILMIVKIFAFILDCIPFY